MKKILNILFLLLFVCTANAQSSAEDMLKLRCAQKVKQMCDDIAYMANPKNKLSNRQYYRTSALKLFIGKGYEYEEDGRTRKGVSMEVTSLNKKSKGHKSQLLIRDYFTNLIERLKYDKVVMQTTDVASMKISDLQQIDDDTYVCTVYFVQVFRGYGRDNTPTYQDKTSKHIKCYVKVEETEDGREYIVLLGDVTATDTQRIS